MDKFTYAAEPDSMLVKSRPLDNVALDLRVNLLDQFESKGLEDSCQ
jgi:hypothetical protein